MLEAVNKENQADFKTACNIEHVFGSRMRTALAAFGPDGDTHKFYLCRTVDGVPAAALHLTGRVLTLCARPDADAQEIAALAKQAEAVEIDSDWRMCQALQKILGGTTESSYYMMHQGPLPEADATGLVPGTLPAVFDVLQSSHEYYRTHLQYASWSADLARKMEADLMELWQLNQDGQAVGTGSIISWDDNCGVIAAVAVRPEKRGQGLGTQISSFLTARIIKAGKTPRLIAGYDEVAALYQRIGYVPRGRWGELYLHA